MNLQTLTPLLDHARSNHYAVGAFSYCNAESAQAVVEEGIAQRSPVMFITGPWEITLLGVKMLIQIADWLARQADVPVCAHLDHAEDIELVRECIEAGFPSVMIDASKYDFEENIRITKSVVELAHSRGVTVEGELGAVGRVDDSVLEGAGGSMLTYPSQAAEFVERTGVDALAVSIGNAHGIYKQQPELDLTRLEAIKNATGVPLVLHGGSGTPPDQLHKAIEIGICKVNVASELSRAFLNSINAADDKKFGTLWYSHALVDAKSAMRQIVGRWMRTLGSTGRV